MKKTKNRSEVSLSTIKSATQCKEDIYVPPLDILSIKVLGLRVPDEYSKPYFLKISFFDQLLLSNVISSSGFKESNVERVIARGYMNYDPSDYEKMCLFADSPLTVRIHPFESMENLSSALSSTAQSQTTKSSTQNQIDPIRTDGFCCSMDILPIFMGTKKLILKQRMEPVVPPSILLAKSWDNLPEIYLCIESIKNNENLKHQNKIKDANFMEITLVGCYNTIVPYDDKFVYTAASKLPLQNDMHTGIFTFSRGYKLPKRFSHLSFYPHWESLRLSDDPFSNGNKKLQINATEMQNENNIDFRFYFNKLKHTVIWASFHRTLILKDTEKWLYKHLRRYQWPMEINIQGENHDGYSFMGFLDLFKLLYPGEKTVHLVIPLQWMDKDSMMTKCGCESLLANNEKVSSTIVQKTSKPTTESANLLIDTAPTASPTGADGGCAFVIIEVSLAKPFTQPVLPPHISELDLNKMLEEMETHLVKRKCTGRGQLEYNWQATVQNAANSLRRVPYYGLPDLCSLNRQMSGSRVRVELMTSFWQEAAIYVNNNFVVNDFLYSDDTFEEMIMIAHACLMRITTDTLTDVDSEQANSTLRAARHARQLQDLPHAVQLYLQLIVEGPREADSWRELATCLKDLDKEWANACINKSIMLHTRHPLSLLSKSCMVFEEDPDAAEPFFVALLALYPFWVPMCVCVSAYYLQREMFHMAQAIIEQVRKTQAEGMSDDIRYPRAWERELGDWWDNTPLLPGTNLYYDAADLLLRIRAITLAEVCVARALTETGECPVYYHLVALCCRLRGQIEDALCHLHQGIEKFGEISYLRSLEGECYHKLKDLSASIASLKKARNCGSYIALLSFPRKDYQRTQSIISDVVRRYPSAYAWMTFADYWMMRSLMGEGGDAEATEEQKSARASAVSCLFKALKYDRRIGRAWTLLASLVKPEERRQYCKEMAAMCDYNKSSEVRSKHSFKKEESLYHLGKAMRECCCEMCENLYL